MKIKKTLIVTASLFIAITSNATINYVATWGNDTDSGSFDNPWATWQKAFETAQAGDTVYFRGGTWYPTSAAYGDNVTMIAPAEGVPIGNDGKPGYPICFFNYPGEKPILDCSLIQIGNFNTGVQLYSANFIHFRGLTIRNVFQPENGNVASAIDAWTCTNITYENITVHDVGGRGFAHFAAFGVPPEEGGPKEGIEYDTTCWINCDAYNCADMFSLQPGNAADGWKIQNYPGAFFYLEGCRAWNCADDGFDMSGSQVGIFNNCWSFNNGFEGALDGNGFKFGGVTNDVEGVKRIVVNCISAYNIGYGFYDLEYVPYYRNNSRVYNNTLYKNGIGIQISENATYPNSLSVYKNNIIYQVTQNDAAQRPYMIDAQCFYTESHNNWDYGIFGESLPRWLPTDTVTVTDEDFVSVDSTGITGPRQADGSLPEINFLKLAQGSDLIDAGVDVGLPFLGKAPDLGAFERE
jgi:hypothetical protein